MDFLKKLEIEVCVVRWWHTHQNEAKVMKLASARRHLSYRTPQRAPRAISVSHKHFCLFFTMWTFWDIECAWCPHYKMKMLRSKRWHQSRHFGGYATFIRFLGKILVIIEIQRKSAFFEVFQTAQICTARAKKRDFEASRGQNECGMGTRCNYTKV